MSTPRAAQFPPLEWLGYGLDLTTLDPFNFKSVFSAKTRVRIVDVTKDTKTQTVTIGGVTYEIPRSVTASEETDSQGFNRTFKDGAVAANALQGDAALAYRLLSVTADNNLFFPLEKSLPTKNQYNFFVNDHAVYSGKLREYISLINEDELLVHVSKLAPFDHTNPVVVQAYIEFFNTVGSHFIISTGFGARFQLVCQVWASNNYEEVNDNFARDVTASVKGLNDGGKYDETVFHEHQYQIFNRVSQRVIRTRGGDPHLAQSLVDSPDFPTFQKWTASIPGKAELVTFRAFELSALLPDATNKTLRDIAGDVKKAFEYISSLGKKAPNDKRTWITVQMESDWAEFGILIPSAVIGGGDRDQSALPQSLALGPPKLRWGGSNSTLQHVVVVAEVINDGSPIDIYISSGSGTAKVNILGKDYQTTSGIRQYSNVPVSK